MKKVFTFFLAMAIIFGISGCGKKEYIVFPFSASDVVKIETYYSNSEADTKEKTLTEEADIDYLYTFFSELPVKDANSDSTNDGSTIKFVFDLSDGTNYELVYIFCIQEQGFCIANAFLQNKLHWCRANIKFEIAYKPACAYMIFFSVFFNAD